MYEAAAGTKKPACKANQSTRELIMHIKSVVVKR